MSTNFNFQIIEDKSNLDSTTAMLLEKASEASENAYSPYSGFKVGAALLLEDSTIIKGSNQENAAYPSGICAERNSLFTYGTTGAKSPIAKLAIVAKKDGEKNLTGAGPCGACRQVMLEYETRQEKPYQVIFLNTEGKIVITPSADSLLPFSFDGSNL